MALYDVVNGIYRKVTKKYDPVDGVCRKVKKAYDPVDGVYRQYFSGGTPVSTLAVGSSVWLKVNGTLTEFLVVHQGRPSSKYHSSCNGTWLLMKDIYEYRRWDSTNNDYANSDVHTYLNDTFLNLFSTTVKSAILQARIPYVKGNGDTGSVASGSSGLSTKVFLLGGYEIGLSTTQSLNYPVDGAKLGYFISGTTTDAKNKRIAINRANGNTASWVLRSALMDTTTSVMAITDAGNASSSTCTNSMSGVRPALILNSDTPITKSGSKNTIV